MENIETVKGVVRVGNWLIKLDLKHAYLTVPIHRYPESFLRFVWEGKSIQFFCLTSGLSPAPRTFTKLLNVAVNYLREQGIRLVIYLDDFFNGGKQGVLQDFRRVAGLVMSHITI